MKTSMRESVLGVRAAGFIRFCLFGFCLLAGVAAQAENLGGYYKVAGNPQRWIDITSGGSGVNATVLYRIPTPNPSYSQTISLPFSFPFPYNGNSYSTIVESDVPVVADRTVSWDQTGYGSHAETSIAAPSTTWFLAEGATHGSFDLFYLIQNPGPTAASVTIRYLRPTPLPAERRRR